MKGEQNWIRMTTLCAVAFFSVVAGGCGERSPAPRGIEATPTATAQPAAQRLVEDACALLTSDEIASVQGEPAQKTRPQRKELNGLAITQCFFALPAYERSISLVVVQKAAAGSRRPLEPWKEMFGPEKIHETESASGKKEMPPMRIADLGDEAFWVGNNTIGALYVLKGDSYITLSVGGPEDQKIKIEKTTTLARAILPRL